MGRKRTVVAAAAMLAGALVLAACGGATSGGSSSGGQTLKIGFMGDLTGENSGIVIPPRNGAKLAIDEYNATNPAVKLQLVEYDSQGSADQAVPLIQQAINTDKIVGLVGPAFSGESKAVGPILEQGKIPSVSASATNPGLAQNGWKYWHRVVANDNDQGPAIADFLIRAKAPTKAFVISDDQEYSVGLADAAFKEFQSKGVAVERDQFAQAASDYSSTVAKVKAAAPNVIVYGGYYAQAGRLLKQLRDSGVTATFASGDGSLDPQLIAGAGAPAAEGAVLACPCNIPFGATEGALKQFTDKYKAAYNTNPAIYSTEGYDAATLFVDAVKAGNTTPDAINSYISGATLDGVSKKISFKPNGEPNVNAIFIYEVKNGALNLLGQSTEAKLG
ncbi:branched-chain amino acid ABC transporter substrate-binding protein [Pseudonocardia acidicola]|uniref:Branched-chain amino acid ABC transporter substrate-binding protein n=1 Tax=Pseudonocardia acidicola TaxID=2724939 RepID=A0ABX1S705_9PSEU|nr:branched-chain amino acid ABC transporter substrate-binding protein [Pseudonocardia acidicola]NMH96151.1 branched-chain amino acid ABC transporter substrate-binding protein [Pseudonocardia acidicola]